jgi:hypothetical protein
MADKIQLDAIVDYVIKAGEVVNPAESQKEFDKLAAALAKQLKIQPIGLDIDVDPNLKFSPQQLAGFRRQVQNLNNSLARAFFSGDANDLELADRLRKQFGNLTNQQAHNVKKFLDSVLSAYNTPATREFSKKQREVLSKVLGGTSVLDLTEYERRLAKEASAIQKAQGRVLRKVLQAFKSVVPQQGAAEAPSELSRIQTLLLPQLETSIQESDKAVRRLDKLLDADRASEAKRLQDLRTRRGTNQLEVSAAKQAEREDKQFADRLAAERRRDAALRVKDVQRERALSFLTGAAGRELETVGGDVARAGKDFDFRLVRRALNSRIQQQLRAAEEAITEAAAQDAFTNVRSLEDLKQKLDERRREVQGTTLGRSLTKKRQLAEESSQFADRLLGQGRLETLDDPTRKAIKDALSRAVASSRAYREAAAGSKDSIEAEKLYLSLLEKEIKFKRELKAIESARQQAAPRADRTRIDQKLADLRALGAQRGRGGRAIESVGGVSNVLDLPKDTYEDALVFLKSEQQRIQRRIKDSDAGTGPRLTPSEISDLNRQFAEQAVAIKKVNAELRGNVGIWHQASLAVRAFFRYAILYGSGFALLEGIRRLTGEVFNLEESLKGIQAVAQATAEDMRSIESAIKQTATTTQFSVQEIAEATQTLAQAGVEAADIPKAIENVALFAGATKSSLQTAADVIASLRMVFSDLSDRTLADQLTNAVNISRLTAEDLKVLISLQAQTAKSFGLSSKQILGLDATLSNIGIKPSTIATGSREALIEILSPDEKTIKALIPLYQKTFNRILTGREIRQRFLDFQKEENPLLAALQEYRRLGIGGGGPNTDAFRGVLERRAENVFLPLLDSLDILERNITQVSRAGAAAEGSETQMEAANNQIRRFGQTILTLTHTIVSDGLPVVSRFFKSLADGAKSLQDRIVDRKATLGEDTSRAALSGLGAGILTYLLSPGTRLARGALGVVGGIAGTLGSLTASPDNRNARYLSELSGIAGVGIAAVGGAIAGFQGFLTLVKGFATKFSGALKVISTASSWSPLGRLITLLSLGLAAGKGIYDRFVPGNSSLETRLQGLEEQRASRQQRVDDVRQQFAPFSADTQGGPAEEARQLADQLYGKGLDDLSFQLLQKRLGTIKQNLLDELKRISSRQASGQDLDESEEAKLKEFEKLYGSELFSGALPSTVEGAKAFVTSLQSFYAGLEERGQEIVAGQGDLEALTDKIKAMNAESQIRLASTDMTSFLISIQDAAVNGQEEILEELRIQINKAIYILISQGKDSLKNVDYVRLLNLRDTVEPAIEQAERRSREIAQDKDRLQALRERTAQAQDQEGDKDLGAKEIDRLDKILETKRRVVDEQIAVAKDEQDQERLRALILERAGVEEAINRLLTKKAQLEGVITDDLIQQEAELRRKQNEEHSKRLILEQGASKEIEKSNKQLTTQRNKLQRINERLSNAEQRYRESVDKLNEARGKQAESANFFADARRELSGQQITPSDRIRELLDRARKQLKGGAYDEAESAARGVVDFVRSGVQEGTISQFDAGSVVDEAAKIAADSQKRKVGTAEERAIRDRNALIQVQADAAAVQAKINELERRIEDLGKLKVSFDPKQVDAVADQLLAQLDAKIQAHPVQIQAVGPDGKPVETETPGGGSPETATSAPVTPDEQFPRIFSYIDKSGRRVFSDKSTPIESGPASTLPDSLIDRANQALPEITFSNPANGVEGISLADSERYKERLSRGGPRFGNISALAERAARIQPPDVTVPNISLPATSPASILSQAAEQMSNKTPVNLYIGGEKVPVLADSNAADTLQRLLSLQALKEGRR